MHAQAAYAEQDIQADDVDSLITDNLLLVKRIVGQLPRRTREVVPEDDLVSAGTVGLVEAAHRYDPSRRAAFTTFAYRRIKGAIMDFLRSRDVLSRPARKRLDRIKEEMQKFRTEEGRKPTVGELAEATGLNRETVLESMSNDKWNNCASLQKTLKDGEGGQAPLSAFIPAEMDTPLEDAEYQERIDRVSEAIKELPEQQQQVIVMYYYKELYMKEIARVLGVSASRISQIHTEAIYNLGKYLEDE